MSYEGRPADYQVARVHALSRELDDVETAVNDLVQHEVPPINDALAKRGLPSLTPGALKAAALEAMPNPFDTAKATASALATQERE
jgi:hypothetical protein